MSQVNAMKEVRLIEDAVTKPSSSSWLQYPIGNWALSPNGFAFWSKHETNPSILTKTRALPLQILVLIHSTQVVWDTYGSIAQVDLVEGKWKPLHTDFAQNVGVSNNGVSSSFVAYLLSFQGENI